MTFSSVKIEGLLGMLTIKLKDRNFSNWVFQFKSVLKGYKLFDHFDGSAVCPPKFIIDLDHGVTNDINGAFLEWETIDMALLSLLLATLSDKAIEHVLGCKAAHEAWSSLQDRGDSIDQFLSKLKHIREQLQTAGEFVSDNDFILATLSGLPREYSTIHTIFHTRDTSFSLREF
ncbi:hypothetical protein D8674_010586 [Pyrus ussuriensis x Pyrus communis]|uniref:Retrotransposon Copia-like N-terminal domain-containing protein n=1 Tax=Pyrus ussuriensis x Pyrus communis TaxID=2448454 RepID=A0A5N5FB62_9ROSA|nr:hypothetical protein D8674_010586 [Pyrus ussuriensis x Pyrus communis]